MRNLLSAILMPALLLTGCVGAMPNIAQPSLPAPLAATTVDDRAVAVAFQSFDTLLAAVDILIDVGAIVPGTPRALAIADGLSTARDLLNRASLLQRAGSGDPAALFTAAAAALSRVRTAL